MEGRQDRSNGWEAIAPGFIEHSRRSTVGVETIRAWAHTLPSGAAVLDLGCGPGSLRSAVLIDRGFALHAIDAAPSLANAYRKRFPNARVACEPVEQSPYFFERFDGVLAWGLLFLLPAETQRGLIHRVASVLESGGSFLFTAPSQECTWPDLSTGQSSLSLGASAYRSIVADAGLAVIAESDDEGHNHYYHAARP